MVHPYGLLSLVLLVHIPVTAASTSFLTPELLSVLSQPTLSNLPDTANLLQNVNNHTARIEQILAAHRQGDQNSAGVLEACQIGRLVLGDRGFLDSSSTVYVNATDDNWYAFLCVCIALPLTLLLKVRNELASCAMHIQTIFKCWRCYLFQDSRLPGHKVCR